MRPLRSVEISLALSTIALIAQLLPNFLIALREWPSPGKQTSGRTFVTESADKVAEIKYLIHLPENYWKVKHWPLLLFLHGSGQRGEDIDRVARCGPPFCVAHGMQIPMIVVSPQCREMEAWQAEKLLELLDVLEKRFSVDPSRIYIAGYSMGGNGVWALLATRPDRFAAAVPVAAGGNIDNVNRLIDTPIWAFHGAHDDVIPLEEHERMVEVINENGGRAQLTVIDDQTHDICNLVFSRSDLYEWLLQRRRPQR